MAGEGILAVPADRKEDVGNVEWAFYAQAGGKKELLRSPKCNTKDDRCRTGGGDGKVGNYGISERWRWVDYMGKQVTYGGGGSTEQHVQLWHASGDSNNTWLHV